MRKRGLLLIICIFCVLNTTIAQNDDVPLPRSLQSRSTRNPENPERKIKFTAGGMFGAQFGSYTGVSVAPLFGIYPGVDWLLIGVGGTYMYTYYGPSQESFHDFGFSVFVRGLIWNQRLIAHLGYEYLNLDLGFSNQLGKHQRIDAHALYIGPGYRQPVSDRVSLYAVLLINIARSVDSRGIFPPVYPSIGVTVDF